MEEAGTDGGAEADLAHNLNNYIVPLSCMNFAKCPFNFRGEGGREVGGGAESKIVPLPLKSLSFVTAFLLQPPLPSTPCIGQCVQTETAVQMQEQTAYIITNVTSALFDVDSSKVWFVSLQHKEIDKIHPPPIHPLLSPSRHVMCTLTEQTKCALKPAHAQGEKSFQHESSGLECTVTLHRERL